MFKKDLIFLNIDISNKFDIFNFLVDKLYEKGYLKNEGLDFKDKLKKREESISTDMGQGISIPHAKSVDVIEPFVAFIKLKQPMVWNNEKNSMISMIFAIGVPEKSEGQLHLNILSGLAKKLIDESFINELNKTNDLELILHKLNS